MLSLRYRCSFQLERLEAVSAPVSLAALKQPQTINPPTTVYNVSPVISIVEG